MSTKLQYKDNVYIIGKCKRAIYMGKIMLCDVTLPSSNLYRTQDPNVDVRKFLFEIKRLIFGEYLYLISANVTKIKIPTFSYVKNLNFT